MKDTTATGAANVADGVLHLIGVDALEGVPPFSQCADRAAAEPRDEASADLVLAADVPPERIVWAWRYRLGLGKLTVLDGDPDVGKSTVTLDLAARITRGDAMPDGSAGLGEPRKVLIMGAAEDGLADTIVPRLIAAGADMKKVVILRGIREGIGGERRMFEAPRDLHLLRHAIHTHSVALVIVDALMAVLPAKVDSHADQDVRRALHPLAELAEETGAAVLFIRHNTKTPGRKAIHRGGGSIAILGVARSALMVVRDAEDPSRRLLLMSKANLAPDREKATALTYTTASAVVAAPDDGPAIQTSRIEWGEVVNVTADDALAALDSPGGEDRADDEEVLLGILEGGPLKAEEFESEARRAGLARDRFQSARSRLRTAAGIVRTQQPKPGGGAAAWWWHLPEHTSRLPFTGSVLREVCFSSPDAGFQAPVSTLPGDTDTQGSVVHVEPTGDDADPSGEAHCDVRAAAKEASATLDPEEHVPPDTTSPGTIVATLAEWPSGGAYIERATASDAPTPRCPTCRGRDWWTGGAGQRVCRTCHPPTSEPDTGGHPLSRARGVGAA